MRKGVLVSESPGRAARVQLADVARRYYLADESKVDIALSLGVSRFKVARMLEAARAAGIVKIEIVDQVGIEAELSRRVREAFGLRRCVVIDASDTADNLRGLVGAAAADMLSETITSSDVLGLPWARTVRRMLDAVESLPRVPIVQLCGSLAIPGEDSPVDLVRGAARLAGGEAYVYYAPLILDDVESARAMMRQPEVLAAAEQASRVTVAVVSIGAWLPGASTVFDHASEDVRAAASRAGAVGEAMGILFDQDGAALRTDLTERIVTITPEKLHAIREVIALGTGRRKAAAMAAFVRGGFAQSIVVDASLGRELLRHT